MPQLALLFFVVAVLAAFLGFSSLAGLAATFAKIAFICGLVLAIVFVILGRGPRTPPYV